MASLAAVALAAAWWSAGPVPLASIAAAAGFAVCYFLLDRHAVVVRWQGQRITVTLTESAVLAALVVLPPGLLLAGGAAARVGMGFATRRPPVKTIFNVALTVLTLGAAYLVTRGLAGAGAPVVVAAASGSVAYGFLADLGVAILLAVVERARVWRVYRERLLRATGVTALYGTSLGLAAVALWMLHPAAALGMVPILLLVHRQATQEARSDRESVIHQRLALDSQALVGCDDARVIAERALDTCIHELGVGGARVSLGDGRSWQRLTSEMDPAREVAAVIVGSAGLPRGELRVWSRRGRGGGGERNVGLVGLVAAQVATALSGAEAIVEARRRQDVVLRQEKMSALGGLVAGVAHEVNNPLTYLRGNIELALLELADAESPDAGDPRAALRRASKQLGVALSGAERIGELVKALRAVSRSATSQEPEIVSVNRVLRDVQALMAAALPPNVEMRWQPDPADPHVVARPSELHQVLLNLTKNAVEATASCGGRVFVRVAAHEASVLLLVEDEGPGMSVEVQRSLFTPFFTTKGASGTGLGLSIAQGIVRQHGGEIDVESSPGRGARFRVRLPVADATNNAQIRWPISRAS